MKQDDIDDVVCEILHREGPDGHVDGHSVITAFIIALLDGEGEEWKTVYAARGKTKFI